ncbi:MAG: ABC transporter substrate-binding protein, partial [Thermodesulfobacteriota bacterium]
PFRGAGAINRAIVSGALDMAYQAMTGVILGVSRGIPLVAVAERARAENYIWVKSDSLILKPAHLKGTTFGTTRMGGVFQAYVRAAFRRLGLEKDVKFVSTGGHGAFLAAMKTGKIHSAILKPVDAIPLLLKGEIRPLISINRFFPKEYVYDTIAVHKPLVDKNPGLVRRAVRSLLQSDDFIRQNKPWAEKQLTETLNYTPKAASMVADVVRVDIAAASLKISRKAVENVRNFLIEYKLADENKVPPVDELFTNRFVD